MPHAILVRQRQCSVYTPVEASSSRPIQIPAPQLSPLRSREARPTATWCALARKKMARSLFLFLDLSRARRTKEREGERSRKKRDLGSRTISSPVPQTGDGPKHAPCASCAPRSTDRSALTRDSRVQTTHGMMRGTRKKDTWFARKKKGRRAKAT